MGLAPPTGAGATAKPRLPEDRERRIIWGDPAARQNAQHIAGGRVSQPEPVNAAADDATRTQSANVERKLAAILAADVVGYSRLMGLDEESTLEHLKAHRRELFDPKIVEHRGRIVKTTGDGLLVEFASVIDAVRCAVEVQRSMAERNANVDPERRLDFRIGINLGDVIIDGDDIYGDGVNIAARLEGLAEPGGIYVSRVVRDEVRDKLDFGFEDMGAQSVKNISRPIHIHRVQIAGLRQKPRSRRRWSGAGTRRNASTGRRSRKNRAASICCCTSSMSSRSRRNGWRPHNL
jgi:class 3 adenylate cyclase